MKRYQTTAFTLLIFLMLFFCSKIKTVDYEIITVNYEQDVDTTVMKLTMHCAYPVFHSKVPFWNRVNTTIDQKIKQDFFGDKTYDSFEQLWHDFKEEHRKVQAEFPDYIQPWTLNRTAKIAFQKGSILSLQFNTFQYTGGAHPNSITDYLNYDIIKGKELTIEDLFVPDSMQILLRIAESEFRTQFEIPEGESLNAHGFYFDQDTFILSQTFAIEASGLLFYYNPYEIAPYAAGPVELHISNEVIQSLMNTRIR